MKEEAKKQGRDSSKLKVFVLTYPNLSESPIADEKRMPMGGTVDQIGSDIAQMKQMGLDHIIFGYLFSPIGDDMKRTVDLSIQLAKFAK